jgi:hypothetical protein
MKNGMCEGRGEVGLDGKFCPVPVELVVRLAFYGVSLFS